MKNIQKILIGVFSIIAIFFVYSIKSYANTVGQIFEISDRGSEGSSPVWGMIRGEDDPWIESLRLDWIYLHPDSSAEAYWIWVQRLGWIYSEVGLFPEVYRYNSDCWVVLDLTFQPALKFLNLNTREWQTVQNPGKEGIHTYGKVPQEILELAYSELGPNFSNSIEIGPYYFAQTHSTRVGTSKSYFFYNEDDGWFYPLWDEGGSFDYGLGFASTFYERRRAKVEIRGQNIIVTWNDRIWDNPDEEFSYPIEGLE